MYQALYRKYRPKSFEDVVGQEVIVQTLTNAVKNDMVSHAYLFNGPRGTGKTSIAKIYAKILNCNDLNEMKACEKCDSCTQINNNQNIDVIEIDAASNNGVDEIREIRNKIGLVPSNSKYKIYIIDEVHMLTNQAFNALLKTLEEPPKHIIFIFATTEPHKIPTTILSRCQRFDFKKIHDEKIVKRLKQIVEIEQIKITDEALKEIAFLSDGGLRDSISLLDQAISYSDDEITVQNIHDINGSITKEEVRSLINYLCDKNLEECLKSIESYDANGKSMSKIVRSVIEELKNIILYCNAPNFFDNDDEFYELIKEKTNNNLLYGYIHSFSNLMNEMKNNNNNKILLEIEIIKISESATHSNSVELPKIENQMKTNPQTIVKEKEETKVDVIEQKIEEKNEKETTVENNSLVNKNQVKENNEKLEKIKKIRINNSLVSVSQKRKNEFKEELEELKILLMDPTYSKYISLLFDGELKAISNENLIFVYKTKLLADAFNLELLNFENVFVKVFNKKYYPIAVAEDEWNEIKVSYNQNKQSYKYIEESDLLLEIFQTEENAQVKTNEEKNTIDELFDSIVEYE
jgi:DNA polymerase-3 subunit gamma/tau